MKQYYIAQNDEVLGPWWGPQVVKAWDSGELSVEAQICEKGIEEWMVLRMVVEDIRAEMSEVHPIQRAAVSYSGNSEPAAVRSKSHGLAFVLSFLIPGLGQLYLDRLGGALFWFATAVMFAVVVTILTGALVLGFASVVFICLLSAWFALKE